MVVTGSIERAIRYYHAISDYLAVRKSPYQAIVAFSGEHEYGGSKVTETSLNGFSSRRIAEEIQKDPYRFLVCAEKYQTGYDEPLLHTMYVDKVLSGIRAVQTLSRLNRSHPKKHDAFVLDFVNDADMIQNAFADYYRTTVLAEETDPDRLHDLKAALDGFQVYDPSQVGDLVERYLAGADRDRLDPILDACVAVYWENLDEDEQVAFKGQAKAFLRAYGFLALDPALYKRRVGEALDLPDLPRSQAARSHRRGYVQGDSRIHRHGQLPGGEASGQGPSSFPTRMRRSGRSPPRAEGGSPNRRWTGFRTS